MSTATMDIALTPLNVLNTETGVKSQVAPFREISLEESREVRYNYRDGALARNSAAIGKKDSTSVWLSKDALLQLLEACDGKPNEGGNEGVRIHWATYPTNHPDTSLAGRQTIVVEADTDTWFGAFYPCPAYCTWSGPHGEPCPMPPPAM